MVKILEVETFSCNFKNIDVRNRKYRYMATAYSRSSMLILKDVPASTDLIGFISLVTILNCVQTLHSTFRGE